MVRKLDTQNNIQTKELYQEIFSEDTREFVDYYYQLIASRNTIYTVEDKAMLHLNPYKMSIYGEKLNVNYIVAVATKEEYRRQGLMKELMIRALWDMYEVGQAFTYLMPAAEAIYTPYDFVVIGSQAYYKKIKNEETEVYSRTPLDIREASISDWDSLAEFANDRLEECANIYTLRDVDYFKRLMEEQNVQNGGIKIFSQKDQIVGIASYANEGGLKYRDVLSLNAYPLPLVHDGSQNMMARIINVKAFLSLVPRNILEEKGLNGFNLVDPIIDDQTGYYELTDNGMVEYSKDTKGDTMYTIGELTSLLFENTSVVLNEIV